MLLRTPRNIRRNCRIFTLTTHSSNAGAVFKFKKGEHVTAQRGSGRIRQAYDSGEFIGYEIERADKTLFMAEERELRRVIQKY